MPQSDRTVLLRANGPAGGFVEIPGGKSGAIRAVFLASRARGWSSVRAVPECDDVGRAVAWIRALGAECKTLGDTLQIRGTGAGAAPKSGTLDAFDCAAVLRFGMFAIAANGGSWMLRGSAGLAARPIAEGISILEDLDVSVAGPGLPLFVYSRGVNRRTLVAGAKTTSQFISGALLAAPGFVNGLDLILSGAIPSDRYLKKTIAALHTFRAAVRSEFYHSQPLEGPAARIAVEPGPLETTDVVIGADASIRAVFLCIPAMLGGSLTLLEPLDTLIESQDSVRAVLEDPALAALRHAGVEIEVQHASGYRAGTLRRMLQITARNALQRGLEIDAEADPDLVPPLVAASLTAPGPSVFRRVGRLRFKESNRVDTLCELVRAFGGAARLEASPNGVATDLHVVAPKELAAAVLDARNDHRIVFAAALAALVAPRVEILGADSVAKSMPDFFNLFHGAVIKNR